MGVGKSFGDRGHFATWTTPEGPMPLVTSSSARILLSVDAVHVRDERMEQKAPPAVYMLPSPSPTETEHPRWALLAPQVTFARSCAPTLMTNDSAPVSGPHLIQLLPYVRNNSELALEST